MWEIFTLFEYLNTNVSKQVFYEPQRYHAILYSDFYTLITGKDDYRENLASRLKEKDKKCGKKASTVAKKVTKVANDDALQLAVALNQDDSESESDPLEFSSEDNSDSDELVDQSADKYKQRRREEKKPYN